MMQGRDRAVGALLDRGSAAQDVVARKLILSLFAIWARWSPWRGDEVSAAAALSVVAVDAAQVVARSLARARADSVLDWFAAGADSRPEIGREYPRFGVSSYDVWNRPARAYRVAVEGGAAEGDLRRELLETARTLRETGLIARSETAAGRVVEVIEREAVEEVQAAVRDEQRRAWSKASRVEYVRRVIHPELAKSKQSCGLCVVAADRVYKKFVLQPMHENCNCETLPIIGPVGGKGDPGFRLNQEDLQAFYAAAGGTGRAGLKNVRVSVEPGGELGPILVRSRQGELAQWRDFTTPEGGVDSSWPTVRRIADQRIAKLETAKASRELVLAHKSMLGLARSLGKE